MGKQKKKKKNTVKCVRIPEGSLLSKNEWIEIHEGAYYRATKRLEEEKTSEKERVKKKNGMQFLCLC